MEAVTSQETALAKEKRPRRNGDETNHHWFLKALANYHQHLAQAYMSKPIGERGKPLVAALEGLEVGNLPLFNKIDVTRFIMPTAILQPPTCAFAPATFTTSMLPLLRCVGVAHTLRLLSALLSERRVVLVSQWPLRLTSCSHAALAMLTQGMLYWQHLYIPVLPPHMWQYLAAPYPYLIGILTSSLPKLDKTEGLGEVLILNLDQNEMETRNIDQRYIAQRLPDLFIPQQREFIQERILSLPEQLASDLQDVLKVDKRVVYGVDNMNLQVVGETAVKATKMAKKTLFKLAGKTNKLINKGVNMALSSRSGDKSFDESFDDEAISGNVDSTDPSMMSVDPAYIYSESCHIEISEQEARIAFTMFFLAMFGNMRWYLSTPPGQQVPQFDGNRFLQEKQRSGEGEGSAIWPLLQNFTQTQMFHEFAKARVDEVRSGKPVAPDTPLFMQCLAYHRQHNHDFSAATVRRNCQQIAQTSPQMVTGQLQANARRNAMDLTSNKAFDGDYNGTIAQLVEQCRECTLVLFDVMSVCWLRLQDCKGLNWKHAYNALQILRNLIYHGPLAAVTEATDGLDKIRALKYYENMRAGNAQQVRIAATNLYSLLVDRSKLFSIRRFCMERRRELANPKPKQIRDRRFGPTVPFRNLHAAASPTSQVGTRVSVPPSAPTPSPMDRGVPAPSQDLLGAFNGMTVATSNVPIPSSSPKPTQDLFGSHNTGPQSSVALLAPVASNPFDPLAAPALSQPSFQTNHQAIGPPVSIQANQVPPAQLASSQRPTAPNQPLTLTGASFVAQGHGNIGVTQPLMNQHVFPGPHDPSTIPGPPEQAMVQQRPQQHPQVMSQQQPVPTQFGPPAHVVPVYGQAPQFQQHPHPQQYAGFQPSVQQPPFSQNGSVPYMQQPHPNHQQQQPPPQQQMQQQQQQIRNQFDPFA